MSGKILKIAVIGDEIYCDGISLAHVLGLTKGRIYQLDSEGLFTREETEQGNLFNMADCVQAYMDKQSQDSNQEDAKVKAERLKAEASIKKSKSIIAALEATELNGKMHRSEDVQAITEDYLFEIRNMIMSLPGQLAVEVSQAANAAECADIIRTTVNRLLLDMTNYRYDPARYEERVRQRQNWESRDDDYEDDA